MGLFFFSGSKHTASQIVLATDPGDISVSAATAKHVLSQLSKPNEHNIDTSFTLEKKKKEINWH